MPCHKLPKLIKQKYLYKGKINLRLDTLKLDKLNFAHIALEYPESVAIVPVLENRKIVLIKQYRYLANNFLWEIPAGGIKKGESKKQAALRELQEETGFAAKKLIYLTNYYTNIGTSNLKVNLFLAAGLQKTKQNLEKTEDIQITIISLKTAKNMILKRQIINGFAVAGILLADEFLDLSKNIVRFGLSTIAHTHCQAKN
ncbi:MAG: NUDIX hydrolase [Candidatus Jacksonbacteria bacterium]